MHLDPAAHLDHHQARAEGTAPGGDPARRSLRIGVGGPVGTGKTALITALCRALATSHSLAVVTNDIYTTEDAQAVRRAGVIDADRVVAVETGGCPHTAIRDDIAANLDAVERLEAAVDPDLVLVESGGDNLTAIFSTALVDVQVFVIDTSGGDDIPRKGGPGITVADLLVINKVDLAPYVGVDLDRMRSDAAERRGAKPTIFTSVTQPGGIDGIAAWATHAMSAAARG